MLSGRRGTTLVELLVALWVTALLAGVLAAIVRGTLRGAAHVRARSAAVGAVQAGLALARHELAPLGPGAVRLTGDSALHYDATRGSGHACAIAAAALVAPRAGLRLLRAPVPGRDTLRVFAEGDSSRGDDDAWHSLGLAAVFDDRCPDGRAALRLVTSVPLPSTLAAGAPLLLREPVELSRYASGGQVWLGARALATGEAIQPVLGPLAGRGGLGLALVRADGAALAPGERAAVVHVQLRSAPVPGVTDSALAAVRLRGRP